MNLRTISRPDYVQSIPLNALPIPDFPGYFATPEGEIYSKIGRPKRRRFGRNSCGYPICGMTQPSGKTVFRMVHRIIAMLFVEGDKTLEVNHIDMNKLNTSASNLEWVTKSQNHLKGHALKPEWGKKTGEGVSRALIATHSTTGEEHRFDSGIAAARWVGNVKAAGNISKACVHGRIAYGFYWAKA